MPLINKQLAPRPSLDQASLEVCVICQQTVHPPNAALMWTLSDITSESSST